MASTETTATTDTAAIAAAAANRPKRVRTGCLTCRERHLKCDEGLPDCLNCKKSNRPCKRGVRLNFIDTTVKTPPITPPTEEWDVSFQDESRDIASEYQGGSKRYTKLGEDVEMKDDGGEYEFPPGIMDAPVIAHRPLPPTQAPPQPVFVPSSTESFPGSLPSMSDSGHDQHQHQRHGSTTSDSTAYSANTLGSSNAMGGSSTGNFTNGDPMMTPPDENHREILTDPEELLFMQVFVEEVGIWMDTMDPYKHFSRLLPFDSLGEPMLLNAFLACGARHLTLVNPAYQDAKAKGYYQTSSTLLLRQMQNPYRDTVIVATTAVILNVYEIMTERALQRMNHIAGARALIKECGWNAKSVGVGAACFWLNVGMELLSCLHFNWQVAWNPDDWGVDMDFNTATEAGREEIWTHRMVWIVAHIANFRASTIIRPGDPPQDNIRLQNRFAEWKRWKDWLDAWEASVPRTMQPLGQLSPYHTSSKSLFPEIWLVKRATIVARLFYHTGIGLLCDSNPLTASSPQAAQETSALQMKNARELCGIVAHVKDRGVASVALRSLHTVVPCLKSRAEQDEVLAIFDRIQKETGWRIDFIYTDLRKQWGHDRPVDEQMGGFSSYPPAAGGGGTSATGSTSGGSNIGTPNTNSGSSLPPAPPPPPPTNRMPKIPAGIVNPTYAKADFARQDNPYEGYYVAPIQHPPPQNSGHGVVFGHY